MAKICPVCGTEFTDESAFCPADGSTLRSQESEGDLVGQVIADRYLVQQKLGEGGMGAVYLAKHVRLPKQAAIKVLRPEMLADSASVARFNQEAANASRIEHEGVARVFDFGETADGTVYLAMEYVKGRSLRDVLDQDGALSLEKTAAVVAQVAGGLDAAHRLGIVHRDLKPDNILVADDDGSGTLRCKVVDFGIAKAIGAGANGQQLTRTGMVVGTPEFMSPEQILAGELDHRSDVYALALVAYQCLTLDLPFNLSAPDRGMTARLVSQPRGLAVVRPDLPWSKGIQAVFDQGLDRDPDQRTPSAGAFAEAFQAAVDEVLGGDRGGRSGTRPVTKASAASATSAPAATPAMRSGTAAATAAPTDGSVPARSGGKGGLIGIAAAVVLLGGGGAWWALGRSAEPLYVTAGDSAGVPAVAAGAAAPTSKEAPAGAGVASAPATPVPPATAGARPGAPAAVGTGAPVGGTSPATPAAPPAGGTDGSAPAAAGANASSASRTLDSLNRVLSDATDLPDEQGAQVGTRVLGSIRALLPRLTTRTDSVWAYIRTTEAYALTGDTRAACIALQSARVLGASMKQADAINTYAAGFGCK